MKKIILINLFWSLFLATTFTVSYAFESNVVQWSSVELSFQSSKPLNWRSFPMQAVFTNKLGQTITLDAYWDGGTTWKVRFAPTSPGTWNYITKSQDSGLNNQKGQIIATAPTEEQIKNNSNYRGQVKVSSNGHYFIYNDGTPVLILGDCHVLGRVSYEDFSKSVIDRKAKGFNAYNMRLAKKAGSNEGGEPYQNEKFDNLNPKYFQWTDKRLQALWDAGLISIFMPDFMGNQDYSYEDVRDITRYLLSRYATFNILYIVTGEYDSRRNGPLWKPLNNWFKVGNYLKEINDIAYKVPIGTHPLKGSSSIAMNDQSWLDYNQIQAKLWDEFNIVPYSILDDYYKKPTRPTFYAEGVYENQHWPPPRTNPLRPRDPNGPYADDPEHAFIIGFPYFIRHQVWVALTTGAAAVDYGEDHIKSKIPEGRLNEILNMPGAHQAANAFKVFRSFEWWKLVPHREWVLVDGVVPPLMQYAFTPLPYCMAEPGKTYIVYIMGNLPSELTITNLQNRSYIARWYDPRKDVYVNINDGKPVNTEGKDQWTIPKRPNPNRQDWVLIMTAASTGT